MDVPHAPVPCIIDTDPGVDDVLAILLALSSPELLVLSIVLTHGNTPLSSTLINLRKTFWALEQHLKQFPEERSKWPGVDVDLRKKLGAGRILVVMGPATPLSGKAVTASYFHGKDGLSNVADRHPELNPPEDFDATQSFYELSSVPLTVAIPTIMQSHPPSTIAYLAIGPLTALAQLHQLAAESTILHHLAVIFVMGGAVDCPGNTSPVAEFNIYADPYAAQVIFSLALPHVHILPLDITTPHTLPFSLYTSLVDPHFGNTSSPSQQTGKSPLVHFTSSFLEYTVERMAQFGGDAMELHDPTIVWALIDWSRGGNIASGSSGRLLDVEGPDDVDDSSVAMTSSTSSGTGNSSSSTATIGGQEEMRKRIELNGFSRMVLERRRSSDLALRMRLELERERERGSSGLGKVTELSLHDQPDELDVEADEQDRGSGSGEPSTDEGWWDDEKLAPGWEWQWREFEIETEGKLTRGMMVSDRRDSASVPVQAPTRQTNRALAAQEAEQNVVESAASGGLDAMPEGANLGGPKSGAKVVIATPGSDTLRAMLLERCWAVCVGLA